MPGKKRPYKKALTIAKGTKLCKLCKRDSNATQWSRFRYHSSTARSPDGLLCLACAKLASWLRYFALLQKIFLVAVKHLVFTFLLFWDAELLRRLTGHDSIYNASRYLSLLMELGGPYKWPKSMGKWSYKSTCIC